MGWPTDAAGRDFPHELDPEAIPHEFVHLDHGIRLLTHAADNRVGSFAAVVDADDGTVRNLGVVEIDAVRAGDAHHVSEHLVVVRPNDLQAVTRLVCIPRR
jgi:hypothetical protein